MIIPLKTKTAMSQKIVPQRSIFSWKFVKYPSWWSYFNTSTPLFSSIKKLGLDEISSILLFCNDQ